MTSAKARIHELAGETLYWAGCASALDDAGLHDAALAADDQAEAADAHARMIARESGNEALMALWDEQ